MYKAKISAQTIRSHTSMSNQPLTQVYSPAYIQFWDDIVRYKWSMTHTRTPTHAVRKKRRRQLTSSSIPSCISLRLRA